MAEEEILKPFHQRAAEAEERLSKLEASLANKIGHYNAENQNSSSTIKELELKLKELEAERAAERKKASDELQRLKLENSKHRYRIEHLLRALKEADLRTESKGELQDSC